MKFATFILLVVMAVMSSGPVVFAETGRSLGNGGGAGDNGDGKPAAGRGSAPADGPTGPPLPDTSDGVPEAAGLPVPTPSPVPSPTDPPRLVVGARVSRDGLSWNRAGGDLRMDIPRGADNDLVDNILKPHSWQYWWEIFVTEHSKTMAPEALHTLMRFLFFATSDTNWNTLSGRMTEFVYRERAASSLTPAQLDEHVRRVTDSVRATIDGHLEPTDRDACLADLERRVRAGTDLSVDFWCGDFVGKECLSSSELRRNSDRFVRRECGMKKTRVASCNRPMYTSANRVVPVEDLVPVETGVVPNNHRRRERDEEDGSGGDGSDSSGARKRRCRGGVLDEDLEDGEGDDGMVHIDNKNKDEDEDDDDHDGDDEDYDSDDEEDQSDDGNENAV